MNSDSKNFSSTVDKMEARRYTVGAGRNALYTRVTELAFKRHVMSSATGSRLRAAFFVRGVEF